MSQQTPGNDDDHVDFSALDFSVADDSGDESSIDALDAYAPADAEDTGTELDAIQSVSGATKEGDEEGAGQLFTVTNPPGTVSVSALMDGRVNRVGLTAKAVSMSESELADEILVIADLASQQGRAGQHTFLLEAVRRLGADDSGAVRDLLENGLELSSQEQADAAEAEVFATRYAVDDD